MTARSFALTFVLLLVLLASALTVACAESPASVRASACAEDDPCWTWPRMGNHQRGVILTSGTRVVVGPCRFARLTRRHRIDWHASPHLRGDRFAKRHGCR